MSNIQNTMTLQPVSFRGFGVSGFRDGVKVIRTFLVLGHMDALARQGFVSGLRGLGLKS